MATHTKAQLRDQVMYDLGILDAATAASAEDSVFVLARIQQEMERLLEYGLLPFDIDGDAIPAAYMVPLARVVAPTLCTAYGKQGDLGIFGPLADEGMRELRRLKAKPYFGSAPATAEYF
jgi:hypothetical protein